MHEHFGEDGTTRVPAAEAWFTVVTREPEWDDHSRVRALKLTEYEDGFCSCGCGLPIEVAYDPKQVFVVDDFTCHAGRALEQVKRQRREEAEKRKGAEGAEDGKHLYVRPHDPDRDKPLRPRGGRS